MDLDPLCSSSPPLSTHVNMCACLVFSSRRIWVSTSTFPVSAVPASTSFANYDASGIRLTRSLRLHSCTPSWRHASITVMQCSPQHQRRQQTSFSTCWMPLQGSSAIPGNTTKDCHVTNDAPGFTLAWHSWASQLQTLSTDTSVSPREGSSVPVGLLYTSIPSCCRQHLHSATRHQLVVPRHRLSMYGCQAFAVASLMTFNTQPDELRNPTVNTTFRALLKTHFFLCYLHG